jgi:signal recognition particle subunit SRP68
MDITDFILTHRERAFLVGDHGSYRTLLSRQLATLRRKLGIATAKNAKYTTKVVTAEEVGQNIEYVTQS